MIRVIAFAAFALALPTSAQAMSAPPLHRADGMTTETQDVGYRYRGVARYGGYRRYGYGTYSPYAYRRYGLASAVESPAAISAEDSSGSETPTEPSREGWTRQGFRLSTDGVAACDPLRGRHGGGRR